ncbi:FeoB-associated Cys-rich membrane protein, partial [Parageobacillus toebii]|uniref:FeoB-associated Cys-rich membrane protein n=1 Tax=Parageobacillus toebii TaxID=153151 RepID=UPI0035B529B1
LEKEARTMIANIVIGGVIFSYAGLMLVRHIKKRYQGKCASCSLADNCQGSCVPYKHENRI